MRFLAIIIFLSLIIVYAGMIFIGHEKLKIDLQDASVATNALGFAGVIAVILANKKEK